MGEKGEEVEEVEGGGEEEEEIMKVFGFGDFDTSKFKDHSDTAVEAVMKSKSV